MSQVPSLFPHRRTFQFCSVRRATCRSKFAAGIKMNEPGLKVYPMSTSYYHCGCGSVISEIGGNVNRHYTSKKHRAWVRVRKLSGQVEKVKPRSSEGRASRSPAEPSAPRRQPLTNPSPLSSVAAPSRRVVALRMRRAARKSERGRVTIQAPHGAQATTVSPFTDGPHTATRSRKRARDADGFSSETNAKRKSLCVRIPIAIEDAETESDPERPS